jgi:uncharacterized damage-inducible protein DinB
MAIADALLGELVHEAATTRRMLERTPMAKADWKPHTKSMTLGRLASHIAEIPGFMGPIVNREELAMDMANYKPKVYSNVQELLAGFDATVDEAKKALHGKTDAELMVLWRFKAGNKVIFELPRVAAIRTMILSHLIHHRGQLSVYLRLNEVPLPSVYGPSADESPTQ